jgi:pimeloyl-ACP methyl ester carboxylesterase
MFEKKFAQNNVAEDPKKIIEVFSEREKYIPEIGEQLENKRSVDIEINGEKLSIDYRELSLEEKENRNGDPVVLLPGFGSGWEGIAELGFSLACEGRKVILLSLPGYGNSSDPSQEYYKNDHFDHESQVVQQVIGRILQGKKAHVIGHSMGSEVMASVAEAYPENVSSLTLLNPAGVNKEENPVKLATTFLASGAHATMEYNARMFFAREKDYESGLYAHIDRPKSPFDKERIGQRLAEAEKLTHGHLVEKLNNISVPITYISGEFDTVYPSGTIDDESSQLHRIVQSVQDNSKIEKSVMARLRHNTTLAPDEITAANIDHYLTVAEQKNEKERKNEVLT